MCRRRASFGAAGGRLVSTAGRSSRENSKLAGSMTPRFARVKLSMSPQWQVSPFMCTEQLKQPAIPCSDNDRLPVAMIARTEQRGDSCTR